MQLPSNEDEFGGVIVEMKEHMDSDVFHTLLKTSLLQWKLQVLFYIFSSMNFFPSVFLFTFELLVDRNVDSKWSCMNFSMDSPHV